MQTILLALVALVCAGAAVVWSRSARLRLKMVRHVESQSLDPKADSRDAFVALQLTRAGYRKDSHNVFVYGSLAVLFGMLAITSSVGWAAVLSVLIGASGLMSVSWNTNNKKEVRLAEERFEIEKRAEETLAQEQLAPREWAGRLAPDQLPDFSGFDVGRVYQAGSGLMAGDFFDVYRVAPTRVAAVIGDVAGKGISASITAFQAKYLLRVFLRQFRDPAQALEELNTQMSSEQGEEFISLVIIVFDTEAGTLRFASAGHPAAWLWHQREVQPLRATGPLVMLSKDSKYYSREMSMDTDDMVLMYTDGLAEVRKGDELFGEDRIAMLLKRDPTIAPDVLCKTMLEAARDFSDGPIDDDVAILAIRRA